MSQRIASHPLEVRTYTGDIRPYIRQLRDSESDRCVQTSVGIAWDEFPQQCEEESELKLVGVTRWVAGQEPTVSFCEGAAAWLRKAHLDIAALINNFRHYLTSR